MHFDITVHFCNEINGWPIPELKKPRLPSNVQTGKPIKGPGASINNGSVCDETGDGPTPLSTICPDDVPWLSSTMTSSARTMESTQSADDVTNRAYNTP